MWMIDLRRLAAVAMLALWPGAAVAMSDSPPPKFPIPWGNSAGGSYIRTIPQASQIGIQNCAASLTDGFPPLSFTPASSGGCPPFGQDFNGILKQITQSSQWQQAGGTFVWDNSFESSIGGYPKGNLLQNLNTPGCFWSSSTDNNTSNPDTGGANWIGGCLGSIAVGSTTITGGTTGRVLYDNAGVLGELTTTGSGSVVLATAPTISTAIISGLTVTGSFTATGLVTNASLANSSTTVNGVTCTLGSSCTISASAGTITIGTTSIASGTTAYLLFNNGGTLGNETIASVLTAGTGMSITGTTIATIGLTSNQITLGSTSMVLGNTYTSIAGAVTFSGTLTASGTENVTGTFQSAGNTMTFPGSAATLAALNLTDQTLSGGANVTAFSNATGSVTVDCGKSPLQFITNAGNYTITAPASDGSCLLLVTNGATAGTTSFNGFTTNSNTGEALDTVNAHKFSISIWRVNGTASYIIKALQ